MARPSPSEPRRPNPVARPSTLSAGEVDTEDWPAQAADAIERLVQGVRDRTTGHAISAARWLVAGLFLILAGTMSAILLAIALVRFLDAYLPDALVGEDHVWVAHGLAGALLSTLGVALLVLGRRGSPPSNDT